MAQASHRTGSYNSFLGGFFDDSKNSKNLNANVKYPVVKRSASTSNHKISKGSTLVRPAAPTTFRATEAHIHRIRSATNRGDFTRSIQVLSLSPNVTKPIPEKKEDVGDYSEKDFEAVDWTAPLDITAYLYKPEYIISRDDINSKADSKTCKISPSSSQSTLKLPVIADENAVLKKDDFIESYVTASTHKGVRGQFSKDIVNYTAFIKQLQDDIREMSEETKRLEIQPLGKNRHQKSRDEIIHRGYVTLKEMYELNSNLAESVAKSSICGPPGKLWMGLTRVEILEIVRRIRKELGITPEKHVNDNPRMNFSLRNHKKSKKKASRKSRKPKKSAPPKERKPKQGGQKLKTPIVPFQHVPGPSHLHTNVCIRPWVDTLDGWNQCKEDNDFSSQDSSRTSSNLSNPPNSPRKCTEIQSLHTDSSQENILSLLNGEDDDFLTLEIFNPIFKLSR